MLRQIGIIITSLFLFMGVSCKTEGPVNTGKSVQTSEKLPELTAQKEKIEALSFDAAGNYYAMGFFDGTIKLFDFHSGVLLHTYAIDKKYLKYKKYNHILFLDFSPDGRLLVSASEDGFARIWDIKTGKLIHELAHPYKEEYEVGVFSLAFSPDSRVLASAGYNYVALWQAESGRRIKIIETDSRYIIDFSPDGKLLLTTDGYDMTLWNTTDWETRETVKHAGKGYDHIAAAHFGVKGETILYLRDDIIYIYDIASRTLLKEYELPDQFKSKYYPYTIFSNSADDMYLGYLNPWEGKVKIYDITRKAPAYNIQHVTGNILVITSAAGMVETMPESAFNDVFSSDTIDKNKNYHRGLFAVIRGLRTHHNFPGYGGGA